MVSRSCFIEMNSDTWHKDVLNIKVKAIGMSAKLSIEK